MIKVINKDVLSSDKQHLLKGKLYIPESKPKGLLHILHGMNEHIDRYEAFMREMAEYGYITFGYDHLGHGHTAANGSERGFFAHKDGWARLVDDAFLFGNEIRKIISDERLPFILMGFSMGSFIARLTAAKYDHHNKLIIMGTSGPNPAAGFGILLCGILKKLKGERACSNLLMAAVFGTYNKGFERENDRYAWLSRNAQNRAAFRKDDLCAFQFTLSAMQDLIRLSKYSNDKSWFDGISKSKPILLLSGAEDPVGGHGAGVRKVYDKLKASGADADIRLYDGLRHEVLRDDNSEQVIADIKAFVDR